VPFDLIAAGTWAATAAFAPDEAGVELVAELELEDDELLLLLLPHPTTAAAQSTESGATNQLLHVRI
jgi:hypothetical protein